VTPEFVSVDDVVDLHAQLLLRYGGSPGIRDRGLLESAVAQPTSSFGGEFMQEDLFAMAAAYLFHIVKNHPFVDGNKRAGLMAALVFLDLNGIAVLERGDALYDLTMAVAEDQCGKEEIAHRLRSLLPSPDAP
jgi:death on curing protein